MTQAFLTVDEVAEIMRCEHRSVRRAIQRGELEAAKIGGRYLIRPAALDEWFDKCAAASPPAMAAVPRRAVPPPRAARRPFSPDRAGSVARLKAL